MPGSSSSVRSWADATAAPSLRPDPGALQNPVTDDTCPPLASACRAEVWIHIRPNGSASRAERVERTWVVGGTQRGHPRVRTHAVALRLHGSSFPTTSL